MVIRLEDELMLKFTNYFDTTITTMISEHQSQQIPPAKKSTNNKINSWEVVYKNLLHLSRGTLSSIDCVTSFVPFNGSHEGSLH